MQRPLPSLFPSAGLLKNNQRAKRTFVYTFTSPLNSLLFLAGNTDSTNCMRFYSQLNFTDADITTKELSINFRVTWLKETSLKQGIDVITCLLFAIVIYFRDVLSAPVATGV